MDQLFKIFLLNFVTTLKKNKKIQVPGSSTVPPKQQPNPNLYDMVQSTR